MKKVSSMGIKVKPETCWHILLDYLMLPVMYVLQFNVRETPQRTHFWNYSRTFEESLLKSVDEDMLLVLPGDGTLKRRRFLGLPFHHLAIFGGWKKFFVLEPLSHMQGFWHVGWLAGDYSGISRVKLKGRVRVLKADTEVKFFGIDDSGQQFRLKLVAEGNLGDGGEYGKITLL